MNSSKPDSELFDTTDWHVPSVYRAFAIVGVVTAVCAMIALGMYDVLLDHFGAAGPGRHIHAGPAGALPPEPRIQVNPLVELTETRERQRDAADTYGWAQRDLGIVRIPLDRAMELVIKEGLPTRTGGAVGR